MLFRAKLMRDSGRGRGEGEGEEGLWEGGLCYDDNMLLSA